MTNQAAANAEIYLLTNADFCIQNATNEQASNPMSVVQALFRTYDVMTSFERQFPEPAQQSLFIQYWGDSVANAYEQVVKQVAEQDPKLEHTDWHKQHFDTHLGFLVEGEKSIPKYLEYLDANRDKLPELVSQGWDSAARKFHRENDGDCSAGGGCPSTSCGAKAIIEAMQAKQGVREVG